LRVIPVEGGPPKAGLRNSGGLRGAQLLRHLDPQVAKRIDIAATALYHDMTVEAMSDLDLSYTPPFGSPWEIVQRGAQEWTGAWRKAVQNLSGAR
jgi:hypothetical protein